MGKEQSTHFRTVPALGCFLLLIVMLITSPPLAAQENDDCLMCHEDPDLTGTRGGRVGIADK